MGEEDSERESGKTEGGGLKGVEMTEEAGLHGRGLNLGGEGGGSLHCWDLISSSLYHILN